MCIVMPVCHGFVKLKKWDAIVKNKIFEISYFQMSPNSSIRNGYRLQKVIDSHTKGDT